jgi:hypothetical protein
VTFSKVIDIEKNESYENDLPDKYDKINIKKYATKDVAYFIKIY